MKRPTQKDLETFCRDRYYSDLNCKELWEPFKDYDKKQIEEWIKDDIYNLERFINKYL